MTSPHAHITKLTQLRDTDLTTTTPGDGDALVWDEDAGKWVPGEGGGSIEAIRGIGSIDDPDTSAVVAHGLDRAPEPGEIQVQPRNAAHDVQCHAVNSENASAFTVEVDPAPGAGKSFEFGWLWVPADLTVPPSYSESVLADSPISYWRLEETAGATTVADAAGTEDLAVNGGDLTASTGLAGLGSGVAFTTGEWLGDGTVQLTALPFTIESWIVVNSDADALEVYSESQTSNNNRFLRLNVQGGVMAAMMRNGTSFPNVAGTTNIADGQPHHLVAVFGVGGNNVDLYLDGSFEGTGATSSLASMHVSSIGRVNRSSTVWSSAGTVDEVAIYDFALSSTRIAAHYSARAA